MFRSLVVVAFLLTCVPASAQREFVEEVRRPAGSLNDVDLDAPDPAGKPLTETSRPTPTPATTPPPATPTTTTKSPTKAPTTAKPPKPGAKGVAVVEEVVEAPLPPPFIVVPTDRVAFLEKLEPHFSALQRGDLTRARKALTGLERGCLEAGVHGVPGGFGARALGRALAREAAVAADDGRNDDASDLLKLSTQVSPDDLGSALARTAVRLRVEGPITAIGDLGEVFAAVVSDPIDRGVMVARVGIALTLAVLFLLVLCVLVIALPALPTLAFDLKMALPRGAHIGQAALIAALVFIAPFLLGAGLVPSLLWVLALTSPYVVRRTRIAVAVVMVCAVALPALVAVAARGEASPSSSAALLAEALFDVDGVGAVATLQRREAAGGAVDVLGQVALANAARREGRIGEALVRYRALVQRHGDLSFVHGGYGVALAAAGEDDLALAELGLAAERGRGEVDANTVVVSAAFNASLLHHKAGHSEKGQSILAPVVDGNTELLAVLRRATFRALDEVVLHNRAFVEVLPPRHLLRALESPAAAATIEQAIGSWLWRGLKTTTATIVLAAFLVLMAVLSTLAGRLKFARACVRCGEPASRRVDGPDVPHDTCAACYHAFISTKSRIDAGVKLRKENAIRRRHRRRSTITIALSVVPGLGHLYVGAVARGLAFAVPTALALAAAVVVSPLWPGPRAAIDAPAFIAVVPCVVVIVCLLFIGMRSALVVAEQERSAR